MPASAFENHQLLQAIPDPAAVRNRLAQIAWERDLLKALLRLSQRKEQARGVLAQQKEAAR
jgi:hypothetical protein